MRASKIHSIISPRNIKPLNLNSVEGYQSLPKIGIGLDEKTVSTMMDAMDALTPTVTTPSVGTPVQFLQSWLPGFVKVQTAARKIDDLVGIMTVGSWHQAEVVQTMLETTGAAGEYGDVSNIEFSGFNQNFERRSIVRFEKGMKVGQLELKTAAEMNIDPAAAKREGASLALEIARNNVGFFGYNNGANRTYGFLNDPNLPFYITVPAGVNGSTWDKKTMLEILVDIRAAANTIATQSNGLIDVTEANLTLAVPVSHLQYLSQVSDYGYSVTKWLKDTYKNMRVVGVPQLSAANGGADVFYLYAEDVADNSTDGGQTFAQMVPSKFQVLGVEKQAKGYIEDYTNATAGILCKRPFAVARYTGI